MQSKDRQHNDATRDADINTPGSLLDENPDEPNSFDSVDTMHIVDSTAAPSAAPFTTTPTTSASVAPIVPTSIAHPETQARGSRPQKNVSSVSNVPSITNTGNVTNTRPKTTNAVTSAHALTTDTMQDEDVPTIPVGPLNTINGLHPEVAVRSIAPGRPANAPSPLVVQPAEFHRSAGEWLQLWWSGIRPMYLLLSLVPMCVGGIFAWTHTVTANKLLGHFHLTHFIGMTLAIILIQSGANLINDYYDYMHGVDITNTLGPGGLIQQGVAKPTGVLNAGLTALAAGAVIGVVIALAGGPIVFLLGILGLTVAYFYSASAHSLSSLALGEVVAFFVFGPFITLGAYLVMLQTGQIDRSVISYGTMLGLFAAATILVNNIRDVEGDDHAGKRTLAGILGVRWGRVLFIILVLLPYVLVLGMSLPHGSSHWLLLTLWTLPMLVVVLTGIIRAGVPASLNLVVRQMLRLETYFALFLLIALVIEAFIPVLPHLPSHLFGIAL